MRYHVPQNGHVETTMRGCGVMLGLMTPLLVAAAPAPKPASWTDATTGHRIVRVDDRPGNYGLYFNYNPFTPDGKRMIYLTPEGIRVADTSNWTTKLVLRQKIDRLLFVGNRSAVAYYSTSPVGNEAASTIWSVDLDTGKRRRIADLPGGRIASINANDTLLAGHRELAPPPAAIAAQGNRDPKTGSPTYAANGPDGKPLPFAQAKELWMDKRLASGVPMEIFTIDIRTGERRTVTQSNDWLNHVLFSPSDPTLLSYCHEGPWQKVDRIWTIRTDGSQKTKVHQRMFKGEIAGHEYWAPDGRTIWYDLIQPMGVRWLASLDVVSGKRIWYRLGEGQGAYHYSSSPDSRIFSGDGNDGGKYISLFRPRADSNPRARDTLDGDSLIASGDLVTERIADLSKQDYTLEPNQHFTPDGKWLVYRANVEGKPAIYAVAIAKAP